MYLLKESCQTGFIPDIVRILRKYDLFNQLLQYTSDTVFPSSSKWKSIVYKAVFNWEELMMYNRMNNDSDFSRFMLIQDVISPHILWTVALKFPEHLSKLSNIVRLCTDLRSTNLIELCHFCGFLHDDRISHIVLHCTKTESLRDDLWCLISAVFDIEFSVFLHSLSEYNLIHVLLGGSLPYRLSPSDHVIFVLHSAIFVDKMLLLYQH
ncbi:hypothetical protein CI610_03357 [invertebrate metagenome]|uniref:Reverse transcriptase zinc-binding domain-containing protein n=1 Tax=invertebrate metagenome TaxID=1711999 RepID=A0A2H9T3B4_9ZZZZ